VSIEPKLYQQQVLPAMATGDDRRRPKRDEVQQRLTAIKSIADEYVEYEDYIAALTIYEVLVSEVIEHFNTYRDEYVAFCVIPTGCMDGVDGCFAGETDDQEIRLASYERSLPSTAFLRIMGWTWMKIFQTCWSATRLPRNAA
jgi:hypothetical protein